MDLETFYPPPDNLVQQEVAVLDFLRTNPYINANHAQFASDAGAYFGRSKRARAGFEFFSFLDVSHDQKRGSPPNLRLVVAARVERQAKVYDNITYCLSVCRIRTLSVLRKFHFDVTITAGSGGRTQPHPRCHIQYCGAMIPQMLEMGVRKTQLQPLHPWLSEPRILSWPTTLALLVDMTLREFPSEKSERFRALPEWRAIVRKHEDLVLKPFLEKCLRIITDHNDSRLTLGDAFYVG